MNCLFLKFSLNIFRSKLAMGTDTTDWETADQGWGDFCVRNKTSEDFFLFLTVFSLDPIDYRWALESSRTQEVSGRARVKNLYFLTCSHTPQTFPRCLPACEGVGGKVIHLQLGKHGHCRVIQVNTLCVMWTAHVDSTYPRCDVTRMAPHLRGLPPPNPQPLWGKHQAGPSWGTCRKMPD